MKDKVLKVLVNTRCLIMVGWTQGSSARDSLGRRVDVLSKDARCYCLTGAVIRSCYSGDIPPDSRLEVVTLQYLIEAIPFSHSRDIITWNDIPWRTKEQVIQVIDRAIELVNNNSPDGL